MRVSVTFTYIVSLFSMYVHLDVPSYSRKQTVIEHSDFLAFVVFCVFRDTDTTYSQKCKVIPFFVECYNAIPCHSNDGDSSLLGYHTARICI